MKTLLQSGFLLFCLATLTSTGCRERAEHSEAHWLTMGTFASLTVSATDAGRLPELKELAQACMERLNQSASIYLTDSEISELNAQAGKDPVDLLPGTLNLLRQANHYSTLSGGAFDVTVAPAVRSWGFSGGESPTALPGSETLAALRALVDYKQLTLSGTSAHLNRTGMMVDLGGIAKGAAVDLCYEELREADVTSALVNLGGNMRCHGTASDTRCWRIGIRNPFDGEDMLGSLQMQSGMAIATSGNYERFVEIDGVRYSHLIDPRTGMPSKGMAGVTVLSNSATEADAMSTALFIMGMQEGNALVSSLPTSEALFVPDRVPIEIWITAGLDGVFVPLDKYTTCVTVLP